MFAAQRTDWGHDHPDPNDRWRCHDGCPQRSCRGDSDLTISIGSSKLSATSFLLSDVWSIFNHIIFRSRVCIYRTYIELCPVIHVIAFFMKVRIDAFMLFFVVFLGKEIYHPDPRWNVKEVRLGSCIRLVTDARWFCNLCILCPQFLNLGLK